MVKIPIILKMLVTGAFIVCASSAMAANKIVCITPDDKPKSQAIHEGLLAGMGVKYDSSVSSYDLGNGYVVEIQTDSSTLIAKTQQKEVIAVVCRTSSSCALALDEAAAKDLLVVATTATSSSLKVGSNLLRLSPSNIAQARAIYQEISTDIGKQRFAMVYEPETYALDLYNGLIAEYFFELFLGVNGPILAAAIPLHEYINLDDTQKSVRLSHVKSVLQQLDVEAVAYFGFSDGFAALTDTRVGGDPTVVNRWYVGDAVYPVEPDKGFAGLKVFGLYQPKGDESVYNQYYYAYDAGKFLIKVIENYGVTDNPERAKFLEIAKNTELSDDEAKTGRKTFETADEFGIFTVQMFDIERNVQSKAVIFNAAHAGGMTPEGTE
jgi:hypothetical protein